MVLSASSIGIIVLATSLQKPATNKKPAYSYFTRDIGMKNTWAFKFDHIKFAFGTNVFDWEFLKNCSSEYQRRRNLRVNTPQTKSRDAIDSFQCQQGIHVLFFANCTGEYMGLGPVCRCQEAIRYWLDSITKDWYIFMDDDIYFRPYALLSLLNGFNPQKPMAFVGARSPRGFALTYERWDRCGALCSFRFPWAQPAIMSRGALEKMRPFIYNNFMTRAQVPWFGTHDVHLGLALWWLSIPILSLHELQLSHTRGRKTTRFNRDYGIYQHVVRAETKDQLSADFLFNQLNDSASDQISINQQQAVGIRARRKLLFFKNNGASYLLKPYAPDHLPFFPPEFCNNKKLNPSDLLNSTADRRSPDQCIFTPFNFSSSPLRRSHIDDEEEIDSSSPLSTVANYSALQSPFVSSPSSPTSRRPQTSSMSKGVGRMHRYPPRSEQQQFAKRATARREVHRRHTPQRFRHIKLPPRTPKK